MISYGCMLRHNDNGEHPTKQTPQTIGSVHFGGPDRPPRLLRDLLEERIDAVPAGGEIDWVTYYFRDRALARALARAHHRGVRVRVAVDGRPRLAHANDAVGQLLRASAGIGGGFKALIPARPIPGFGARGRVHAKIYCFSHPHPAAYIGSFNPSGDEPEDPAVTAVIGDQDRGHNTLVEITDRILVPALVDHARRVHDRADRRFWRFRRGANRIVEHDGTRLYFYPRLDYRLVVSRIGGLGAGDRLRIASSHVKGRSVLRALCRSRERGAEIGLITHDTERRAPGHVTRMLRDAGVDVRRYRNDSRLPMHNKFMLLERGDNRDVYFGSLNLNTQSQLLNHEVLACSVDPGLFASFADRWEQIHAETLPGE